MARISYFITINISSAFCVVVGFKYKMRCKNLKTQNKLSYATYLVTGIDWIPVACLAIGEADMMIRDDRK